MTGLDISEEEFCKMSIKSQNLVLFKNIKEIKTQVGGYKFYYKIAVWALGGLASAVSFMYYYVFILAK